MQTATADIETLTVNVILAFRAEHLHAGGNGITHWDKLQNALRVGSRTCADTTEWLTTVRNQLQIGAPDDRSAALICDLIKAAGPGVAYLEMIESRYGKLMARARVEAKIRAEAKEAVNAAELAAGVEAAKKGTN